MSSRITFGTNKEFFRKHRISGNGRRGRQLSLETLESRTLLAASAALSAEYVDHTVSSVPLDIRLASDDFPAIPSALEGKLDQRLWRTIKAIEGGIDDGSFILAPGSKSPAKFEPTGPVDARVTKGGTIQVYAESDDLEATIKEIESLDVELVSASERVGAVEIWVSYDQVTELAALSSVEFVRMPMHGIPRAGVVTSAGDADLRSDLVRSRFAALGVDGSGIRVGVISDGVDNRSEV